MTPEKRLDRLELMARLFVKTTLRERRFIRELGEKINELSEKINIVLDSQIEMRDVLARNQELFARNEERFARNEERFARNEERFMRTEQAIDRLITAQARTDQKLQALIDSIRQKDPGGSLA